MSDELLLAQKRREYMLLDQEIDERIDKMLGLGAKDVTPHERWQLRGLLKYYAKKPHPFRACYRDNYKRFGPRTAGICATLKDIIRGTTHWRGKGNKRDKGTPGIRGLSDEQVNELLLALDELTEADLWEIMGQEMLLEATLDEIRMLEG